MGSLQCLFTFWGGAQRGGGGQCQHSPLPSPSPHSPPHGVAIAMATPVAKSCRVTTARGHCPRGDTDTGGEGGTRTRVGWGLCCRFPSWGGGRGSVGWQWVMQRGGRGEGTHAGQTRVGVGRGRRGGLSGSVPPRVGVRHAWSVHRVGECREGGVSRGCVTRVGLCRAWVGTRVGEWEPMWLNHPEWVSGSHAWGGGVRIWRCHAWVCATSG